MNCFASSRTTCFAFGRWHDKNDGCGGDTVGGIQGPLSKYFLEACHDAIVVPTTTSRDNRSNIRLHLNLESANDLATSVTISLSLKEVTHRKCVYYKMICRRKPRPSRRGLGRSSLILASCGWKHLRTLRPADWAIRSTGSKEEKKAVILRCRWIRATCRSTFFRSSRVTPQCCTISKR